MRYVLAASVLGLFAGGCAYNNSNIYTYMTTNEMNSALSERYCFGMSAYAVEQQLRRDSLVYFIDRLDDGEMDQIEARVLPAGFARQTRPQFGRLFFGFGAEGLDELLYAVPDRETGSGWYPPRTIPLERCEQEGANP